MIDVQEMGSSLKLIEMPIVVRNDINEVVRGILFGQTDHSLKFTKAIFGKFPRIDIQFSKEELE